MRWLRDFRSYGHPLLLIGSWVLLQGATFGWTALVPLESYTLKSSAEFIVIAAIFVAFLAGGSRLAWWFAIFFNVSNIVIALGAAIFEPARGLMGVAILQGVSLWLIWSGNVELYVQESRRKRLVSDTPPNAGL